MGQGLKMGQGKKPATYADIEALPDGWVGELLEDELLASPRPAVGHAHCAFILSVELGGPFSLGRGGPGGWWLLPEPELHLGRDILVPDLAGWRRERMPSPPSPRAPFVPLAPDWVCEVLSPSTARVDRHRKLPVYFREGVRHAWLIDPLARTLEVLRREAGGWTRTATHSGDAPVRAEPFEAVVLGLGALWLGPNVP
jgi:Uma2 family endonuclease